MPHHASLDWTDCKLAFEETQVAMRLLGSSAEDTGKRCVRLSAVQRPAVSLQGAGAGRSIEVPGHAAQVKGQPDIACMVCTGAHKEAENRPAKRAECELVRASLT